MALNKERALADGCMRKHGASDEVNVRFRIRFRVGASAALDRVNGYLL
jgi:hypothetical protein